MFKAICSKANVFNLQTIQDLQQVSVIPTGHEPFIFDSHFGCFFLLQ